MQFVEAKGVRIPAVGLGTMMLKDDTCIEIVSKAIQLGYRNIDTAQLYGNEREVGEGIRASGVKREDIFLTTKVTWNRLHEFEKAVDDSLAAHTVPFVDLLLIHWQGHELTVTETVKTLCTFKRKGLAKNVGVANFTVAMLDEAVKAADEPLINNQIEVHPFLDQSKVVAACRKYGLSITAYCPNARGKVFGNPWLERIGKAHGKNVAQVALRWLVQQDMIPIPRTANPQHLADNIAIFDFTLSDGEMAEIAALARPDGRVIDPPHAPQWDV
jgi:diketogulonate reductase-like aldo/keto reductase